MRFSDIVDHLGNRGFATREQWGGRGYVVFGIDNIGWMIQKGFTEEHTTGYGQAVELIEHPDNKHIWTPCLAEINAEDWQIVDMYWECPRDDFKPFEK